MQAAGCELAQGYLYARPMPATAVAEHLDHYLTAPVRLPDSSKRGNAVGRLTSTS